MAPERMVRSQTCSLRSSKANSPQRYTLKRGVSPGHFIRQQRMQLAAQDLAETQQSVAKIANRCGYRNAASFARAFRAFFGKSPLIYRERSRF